MDIVQETGIKTIPKKKKCKKAKWLSEEALQIAEKRREEKSKGQKERYTHWNAKFQGIARTDKKAFLSYQCKEIEENNRMGKTRDLFKKIRDIGIGAGGEGDDRGWDGWMASLTWWTWVWVNSRSWWWTGRPGVLRFMGSQRVRHDWVTELNWWL